MVAAWVAPGQVSGGRAVAAWTGWAFQIVLLAYVAGISGFGREFARLQVTLAGVPVFTGEVAIALLAVLGAVHMWAAQPRAWRVDRFTVAISMLLALGSVWAAVGLARGFGLAVFRDFAIVYYSIFSIFTLVFLRSGGAPAALALALIAGAVAGGASTLAGFLVSPALDWGHGAAGHQALVAWIAVLAAVLMSRETGDRLLRAGRAAVVAVGGAVILLSAYRTMLLVVAGVAVASCALLVWHRRPPVRRVLAVAVTALAVWVGVSLAVTFAARPAELPRQADGPVPLPTALWLIAERWAILGSTVTGSTDSPTARAAGGDARGAGADARGAGRSASGHVVSAPPGARSVSFRVEAWRRAVARIRSSPLLGIGFGPAPNLYPERHCELLASPTSNCGNAHNTYLTLAMRMGLPVLAAFVLLNAAVIARALRRLRGRPEPRDETLLVLSLAALASLGLYATTSLFLESPYLSSLYWIVLALNHFGGDPAPAAGEGNAVG